MSYQSLIVNAERIAVGSGLQQENIFGMIDHNTHFRFPHFSILYLSFFSSAQEVFNNDVFRLRFRHAERSEFQ